ncbi:MAG: response regulator [Candidatus Margulisiibacteriota bacterium]
MKKHILLLEDDSKTAAQITSFLEHLYKINVVPDPEEALDAIAEYKPDVLIIDYDLRRLNGLDVYRNCAGLYPNLKTIMMSSLNDVPLAVRAAKLGVFEFLHKPLDGEVLLAKLGEAVQSGASAVQLKLSDFRDVEWLYGPSGINTNFLKLVEKSASRFDSVALVAEAGIDVGKIARIVHQTSKPNRRFVKIDLSAFSEENFEAHLWNTIREVLSKREDVSVSRNSRERIGTAYFEGLSSIPPQSASSLLEYFTRGKQTGKFDPSIRIIVSLVEREGIKGLEQFDTLVVPSLKQRKEDLPIIIDMYLDKFSRKYQKNVSAISPKVAAFLAYYDFPGNYFELRDILAQAILICRDEVVNLQDLPVNWNMFSYAVSQRVFASLDFSLGNLRLNLEKNYLALVSSVFGGDDAAAARFVDMPKSVYLERRKSLNL